MASRPGREEASDAARGGSPDAAAAAAAALADGQRAAAALASRGSDRTVTFLEDSLIGDESPSRRSFVRKPTSTAPPRGTPKALAAPRNGLLSDECEEQEDVGGGDWAAGEDEAGFAKAPMNTTASTWLPASLDRGPLESPMETTQEEFFRSEMAAGSARATAEDMFRPETPILMFVDRASFPGHVDPDGHETLFQPSACDAATPQAAEPPPVITDEAWEAELLEWKRRYGCPDALAAVAAEAPTQAAAAAEQAPALLAAPPPEAAAPAAPCQQVEEVPAPRQQPLQPVRPEGAAPPGRPKSGGRRAVASPDGPEAGALAPRSPPQAAAAEQLALLQDPAAEAAAGAVVPAERTLASAFECDISGEGLGAGASPGRRYLYTARDLETATTTARSRLGPGGAWKSQFAEAGTVKNDFFADLRKQREREKGRQAVGPLWVHLASQAKGLASSLVLGELLETMKLFCSVRYEDYELFLRLLGEMPHYMGSACAGELCELIRLLARRRLRERNYVDMVAAQLLKKVRVTDDALPARMLVKTANAFAALECRAQPKFVEHFLRHMEHRIEELDGALCCLVSPLCVSSYMSDSLRCAYVKRCAETQAGFHAEEHDLRNMTVTELLLRKEHHSFVSALPAFVGRYLEKIRRHAQFDQWSAAAVPQALAPSGPRGSDREEVALAMQKKSSAAAGGSSADVFSSQMHRDVSACLTHLGIVHENGALCGPFLLDIVATDMVNPAKRIVYEINSPHHYYEGTEQLTAEKRLRQRLLGRLGQKLHAVNAHDWRPLTSAQKMKFILELQDAQQEENAKSLKQQAAANVARAPLPAIQLDAAKQLGPFALKSARDLSAKIRVPVPPSQRGLSLSAR